MAEQPAVALSPGTAGPAQQRDAVFSFLKRLGLDYASDRCVGVHWVGRADRVAGAVGLVGLLSIRL